MTRSLFMLVLLLGVTLPTAAQEDEPGDQPVEPQDVAQDGPANDAQDPREQIEQIKRFLEEAQDLKLDQLDDIEDIEKIEEQLRRLVADRHIQLQVQRAPDEWQLADGRAVEADAIAGKPYVDPLAERTRAEVLALLDDDDYKVREQAEAHLLMDDTLDKAALGKLIQQVKTQEQRYRLLRVAEHHVMRQVREQMFADEPEAVEPEQPRFRPVPRQSASIGFSYSPFLGNDNPVGVTPGVTVTATMPGFPGHALLRAGDRVVAINGQTMRGIRHRELITSWISNRIAFHQPGDTITLTVYRAGELLAVPIVCAQGSALNQMYATNGLDAAFRQQEYTDLWLAAREELVDGLAKPTVLTPAQ